MMNCHFWQGSCSFWISSNQIVPYLPHTNPGPYASLLLRAPLDRTAVGRVLLRGAPGPAPTPASRSDPSRPGPARSHRSRSCSTVASPSGTLPLR